MEYHQVTLFYKRKVVINLLFIGSPCPGLPGGGAPPNNVGTGAVALSLVPPGLFAIAIFPPYATPRTVPAISVIFAENPAIQ